jgi:hypothetical protein
MSTKRPLLVGIMPTFAARGCRMVSTTDPYSRILRFLDWVHINLNMNKNFCSENIQYMDFMAIHVDMLFCLCVRLLEKDVQLLGLHGTRCQNRWRRLQQTANWWGEFYFWGSHPVVFSLLELYYSGRQSQQSFIFSFNSLTTCFGQYGPSSGEYYRFLWS